jgi:exopolyphosphatase/guanosine-5'-triphosphate,3'-diphosphate pyrophosphatase
MSSGGIKMIFAAIDIGTNSIRLLIAEYENGQLDKLVNKLRTPRLGAGINNGSITDEAMERAIEVLIEYKELIDGYDANYRAVATSAIRDADNRNEFLEQVKLATGIEIDVISGLAEAELSYLGIANGLSADEDEILAIDIGGGSTEFVVGSQAKLTEYKSINLGAVRLHESYGSNIEEMVAEANNQTKSVLEDKHPEVLIGVGGTITTLAAIDQELAEYQPQKIQGYQLELSTINDIVEQLIKLPLEERKKVVGLQESRADIIIGGIVILLEILKLSNLKRIRVSDYGIMEGIIYNKLS